MAALFGAAFAQTSAAAPVTGRLDILAVFRAKPGQEEALRTATLAVVAPTRAEAGCLEFIVQEDAEAPGSFYLREAWTDQAALLAHFQQPYLKALVEQHRTLLAEPLKLHRLIVYP